MPKFIINAGLKKLVDCFIRIFEKLSFVLKLTFLINIISFEIFFIDYKYN
jgi:hypothetical protein